MTSYFLSLHQAVYIKMLCFCSSLYGTTGLVKLYSVSNGIRETKSYELAYRASKSRARKRGWGQLGAGGPYSSC